MVAKYDPEQFLEDLKTILVASLNAKITEINTEKGDGFDMKSVDSDAYFFQGLNERVASHDPFVLYGIEEILTISDHGFNGKTVEASIIISASENGVDNIDRIMFRYGRALEETIQENWQLANNGVKLIISNSMPISFKLVDSDEDYKAVGVNISASIG